MEVPLDTLFLRYGTNYKTAFIDARSILNDLNDKGSMNYIMCFRRKERTLKAHYYDVKVDMISFQQPIMFFDMSGKINHMFQT